MQRLSARAPPAAAAEDPPGVEPIAAAAMDLRLRPGGPRPLAVALSGGGDSVALLRLAHAWASSRGRRLLVLTVDHRLQPQSGAWTEACAGRAAALGADFRALAWTGEKPQTGLAAAARAARHHLLAEAARAAGARVILTGHTADDVAEARAMRDAGATTPEPRAWTPAPAWPEGRELFLLRPLLTLRRAALRAWLLACGETWIEDPANADPRSLRARVRAALPAGDEIAPGEGAGLPLADACTPLPDGGFEIARAALREADVVSAARLLGLACVCAGGGSRPASAETLRRLARRVADASPVVATAAGARIVADAARVRIVREAGEARRGGLVPLRLAPGASAVWDGRFELTAGAEPIEVRPLAGLARRLPAAQRRALAGLPAEVRGALPAVVSASGAVASPLLGASGAVAHALTFARLRAAAGLIGREPA